MIGLACMSPKEFCNGPKMGKKVAFRIHRSAQEVLACYGRYLLKQGYTRISRREFRSPNDGPILVLSKKPARAKQIVKSGAGADGAQRGKRYNIAGIVPR